MQVSLVWSRVYVIYSIFDGSSVICMDFYFSEKYKGFFVMVDGK